MFLAKTADTNPGLKATLERLHAADVGFAVCANTKKKRQITKDQLVPLATMADSGVGEVIRKQEAGYTYIKSRS